MVGDQSAGFSTSPAGRVPTWSDWPSAAIGWPAWTDPARSWSWSRRRGGLIVRASFSALHDVDPVSQIFKEHMTLEAVENGTRRVYHQTHLSRMVFPQELRALVELAGGFEFVQWFFGFKPHQTLERSKHPLLMVVVLRRTRRGAPPSSRRSSRA